MTASSGRRGGKVKVALYEPTPGGHRPIYLRRIIETLAPTADVVVAVCNETIDPIADLPVEIVPLGPYVPQPDGIRGKELRELRDAEVAQFYGVSAAADHGIHLFADALMGRLWRSPPAPTAISTLVFFPRAHYPRQYASPLTTRERLASFVREQQLSRWRRRADAHVVWTLDEGAAKLWARDAGAEAVWFPEPPVTAAHVDQSSGREGCALYGSLAARKGIDLLARALSLERTSIHVTLAGGIAPRFRDELDRHIATMRSTGVQVDLRGRSHSEAEGLQVLAGARCAVLPYPRHTGMSRVMLEAASVGTPLVVNQYGLLGHLTRTHGLGLAVDVTNPRALRRAILELCEDGDRAASYKPALDWFARRYTSQGFRQALLGPLGLLAPPNAVAAPEPGAQVGTFA